jgi:two-component system chemotaxis response regulator CheY
MMIVDDCLAMPMIVKRSLRQAGFETLEFTDADDGATALAAIRAKPPDLLLSDWNMPDMTRLELLESLAREGIRVRFGFTTTEATAEMRARATSAGA